MAGSFQRSKMRVKLKLIIFLLVAVALKLVPVQSHAQKKSRPEIGIASGVEHDSMLYASGYRYLVESVPKLLSPREVSDEQFLQNLEEMKKLQMKIYAVNIFIPGELKVVGPEVDQEAVLSYVRSVFQRCKKAGIGMMVFGSGGARRIPDGFDRQKAKQQVIDIGRKISLIAREYDMVVALENLNSGETNFINTVAEALDIVREIDHPNFRLCVDIYHMLVENESPEIIAGTKKYIIHCDVAEKENRAAPGVKGDDFRPYLKALSKIGYNGKIIIEARWQDLANQSQPAYRYLEKQILEAY